MDTLIKLRRSYLRYNIFLFSLDEMDVALNQISDLHTRIVEMDRIRKQLEAEKLSLGSTIEDYREQLQIEISKYNSLSGSVERMRNDLEKKIAEKEEELELLRSGHRRQIEQLQAQLEELEVRYKTDINRLKSKFQAELDEIRLRYESLKKVKAELENHLKKLQVGIKEAQDRLIEEQTLHDTTRDLLNAAEKRNGQNLIFIEITKSFFLFRSSSWRNRRIAYLT
jgi:myosin heavy chain 6/7